MTDSLPPSKFGAGYSYGDDQASSVPAPAYDQSAYGQPPVGVPATPAYPPASTGYPAAAPGPVYPATSSHGAAGYPQRAGGGTAITAGILALLIGASRGYAAFESFRGLAAVSAYSRYGYGASDGVKAFFAISGGVEALTALLLIIGGLMLFSGSAAGRRLVIVGGVIALLEQAAVLIYLLISIGNLMWAFQGLYAVAVGSAAVGLLFVILMLIFASVGATKRWCQAKKDKLAYAAPVVYR